MLPFLYPCPCLWPNKRLHLEYFQMQLAPFSKGTSDLFPAQQGESLLPEHTDSPPSVRGRPRCGDPGCHTLTTLGSTWWRLWGPKSLCYSFLCLGQARWQDLGPVFLGWNYGEQNWLQGFDSASALNIRSWACLQVRADSIQGEWVFDPVSQPTQSGESNRSGWRLVVYQVTIGIHRVQSSVQFSRLVTSNALWPHGLQHTRLPCPSATPGACSNSCLSSQWCHPSISSFVVPFSPLPSIFPSIGVFSNESALHIRWPKYWGFSFSISPSSEYSGLISFRIDWLDLLAGQGTLKSLLQHHSSKASIFCHSAFFIVISNCNLTVIPVISKTNKHQ